MTDYAEKSPLQRKPLSNAMRITKMRKQINRSLLISLAIHIGLMLAVSPFLVNHLHETKGSLSVEILKPEPEKQRRQRVLQQRPPVTPQVSKQAEASPSAPAASTYAPQVIAPKAPQHADVAPEIVTHAEIPQTDAPALPNASFGDGKTAAGPVVIEGSQGTGYGGPGGRGTGGSGNGIGGRFIKGTQADEPGLIDIKNTGTGLGIFDTTVMPGHGLTADVYVLEGGTSAFSVYVNDERVLHIGNGPIAVMPNFELLTPIYTFVTANLNVPPREYTEGFPSPKQQTIVENFAIRFRGQLAVDTPGEWTFALYSDDGSKLFIDGQLVVDNDGIHAPRLEGGSVKLTAGMHPVEIHYFQGPRHIIAMQWFYLPPNGFPDGEDRHSQSQRFTSGTQNSLHSSLTTAGRIVPPELIYAPGATRVPDALKKLQQRLSEVKKEEKR